jgi:xylulose-5-phosphate/fructose-6-phosphate phosphoketolase
LQVRGAHAREWLLNRQIDCRNYAYEHGIDMPEIVDWKWPL